MCFGIESWNVNLTSQTNFHDCKSHCKNEIELATVSQIAVHPLPLKPRWFFIPDCRNDGFVEDRLCCIRRSNHERQSYANGLVAKWHTPSGESGTAVYTGLMWMEKSNENETMLNYCSPHYSRRLAAPGKTSPWQIMSGYSWIHCYTMEIQFFHVIWSQNNHNIGTYLLNF